MVYGLGLWACFSGCAWGVRLFFRRRGTHPIARLRGLVVTPRPPNYAHLGFTVPTPKPPLLGGLPCSLSPPGVVFTPHHTAAESTLKFRNCRKGVEQRIGVAEALGGLHTWVSSVGVQDEAYKTSANASVQKFLRTIRGSGGRPLKRAGQA